MSNRGFTLIELILAMLILALIGTQLAGSVQATFRTQRTVAQVTSLQEAGTSILNKIRQDLAQTFHVQTSKPLTNFRGEDDLTHDRILFTALAHFPSQNNARESDQTEITYETESNSKDPNLYLLRRRETPFLSETEGEGGEFITIADNVLEFNLEYSDGTKFRPDWDIRSPEQLNKLPKMVRISLRLRDEQKREQFFKSVVSIPMSESLDIGNPSAASPTPSSSTSPSSGQAPAGREGFSN